MEQPLYIYFDEFGHFSPNQHKDGSYSHFVYCALIFQTPEDKDLFESLANEIITKDFSGNLFKSKNLKAHNRLRILAKLQGLKWRLSVFVVDQRKLEGALSEYKRSFLKYFQRIFLKGLTENVKEFHIQFDKLGSIDFQNSLQQYMDRHITNWDLFNQVRSYRMHDEKRERNVMLCFADFFANSLGQYFCKSHYREESTTFLKEIIHRVQITHFPYKEIYDNKVVREKATGDDIVANIALQLASEKLEKLYIEDRGQEYQALLEFLIYSHKLNPNRLLSLQEITDHLQYYFPGINDDRSRAIISELREMDILIISSKGRPGYKLPNCIADFDMFFKRYLDSVVPMLRRIDRSHQLVSIKSKSEVDLLSSVSNEALLKALINVVNSV